MEHGKQQHLASSKCFYRQIDLHSSVYKFLQLLCVWNSIQAGTTEVAVKVVRREFFKQDPKVRENLDREIRILKLLRGCEYVVQLYHVQVSGSFKKINNGIQHGQHGCEFLCPYICLLGDEALYCASDGAVRV